MNDYMNPKNDPMLRWPHLSGEARRVVSQWFCRPLSKERFDALVAHIDALEAWFAEAP